MSTPRSVLLLSDNAAERDAAVAVLKAANPAGETTVHAEIADALEAVCEEEFDCVFCHQAAGPQEAVNFLTEVWNRTPGSGRFVLGREIDAETQVRCAFGGHYFLSTPLEVKAVEVALTQAEVGHAILPNDKVRSLISRMRSLPSKPSIYFEVLREMRSEHATASAVAQLIRKDLGIATKLLQVVNSLFYGRAETIYDIEEAVLFLGFDVTASIVLTLEAMARFDGGGKLHELSSEIWNHSQVLAELARRIAQSFGANRAGCDQTFLAGLLHDLGKLVLAQNYPEWRTLAASARKEQRPLHEVEAEKLALTHAEAGAYLLAVWGLPVPVIGIVAQHHSDRTTLKQPSPAVAIHIAEEILESELPIEDLIANYPAKLGLFSHIETLSALMPGPAGLRRARKRATAPSNLPA